MAVVVVVVVGGLLGDRWIRSASNRRWRGLDDVNEVDSMVIEVDSCSSARKGSNSTHQVITYETDPLDPRCTSRRMISRRKHDSTGYV